MDCNGLRLLVADGAGEAREFLAAQLTADGYEVRTAASRDGAFRVLRSISLDAAILALSFEDGDGLELARLIRRSDDSAGLFDRDLPLIAVSPTGGEIERLRAFEHGCDDFLTTPIWYPELRARLAVLLRRRASLPARGTRVRVGRLELDVLSRQAWVNDRPVRLSSREFSLLRMLASNPQRVFTREELLRGVWGWTGADGTRTVDTHACRLRRKLGMTGDRYVINVWGVGYRLIDATATALALSAAA